MSSGTDATATSNADSSNPARRGRGRGRAQGANRSPEDPASATGEGNRGRGGRRGGRGRGNKGGQTGSTRENGAVDDSANTTSPGANRGNFGAHLTQQTSPKDGVGKKGKQPAQDGEEDQEGEICFICASPVVHQSIAPCNHRTCHICSLRLRALYKNKACAHCRTSADFVIFTDDANKRFEDFASELTSTDNNLGIKYESAEICEDTVLLLRYNCPDESCDVACLGWPDLHRHVKSVHHKVMCDLCTRNKKVFTHEHELFTVSELRKHEKFGDDNPGAVDQSGFKGHPECGFCRQRFYGDDELYMHCRDKHERCHICDRRNGGNQPQYYVDYNALEVHFKKDHFMCPDTECLEKKFVVFESEMDLKAHQLEAHPNGLSKDARRDARRVDMSGFNYRAPHEDRGGRQGRGRGRGRDPNAEPLPQSSAQPLRRDELAYQRQMAIQSAQSVTSRTFGGQLTSTPTEAFAARPPPRAQEPPTVTAPRPAAEDAFPSLSSLSLRGGSVPDPARTASPATETPQEQARRLRHNAVTERASNLLRNDQTKVAEFRNNVSLYKNGSMTAAQLIEGFFSLFDTSSAELGKLVKELAEIFEIPSKREGLLKAWNNWKAINEDYPSLPSASGSGSAASAAGAGGSRVLKLKSSTAQSSRSAVSQKGSWGTAGRSSGQSSNTSSLFPPLSSNGAASSSRAGQASTSGWGGSAASSSRPSPAPSRTQSEVNVKKTSEDAFPALPAAKKPTSTVFTPGYNGRAVRNVNGTGPAVNAWGVGGSRSEAAGAGAAADDEETFPGSKKKGNRNKKQTLFHFG